MTMTSTIAAASADTFVFFDSRVAGWQTLAEALPPGSAWYLIDGASDGLAQIAAVLAGRSDVQAVHIVSHGAEGSLQLGSSTLTADTLHAHAGELTAIGATLAENGDILLYGCETGAGSAGAALVDAFAALSGADVAASIDVTGAAALGGNWLLERSNGQVDAMTLGSDGSLAGFAGTLATSTSFDFSSGIVNADDTPDGAGRAWMSQTIGGHTLTLTADAGVVSVLNEDLWTGMPDPVMQGAVFSVDVSGSTAPNTIRLSLDGGKLFDLTRLSIVDLSAGLAVAIDTLVITTNRGPVEVQLNGQYEGMVLTMPDDAKLRGVSWADFSDKSGNPLLVEFDDIVLSNITTPIQPPTILYTNIRLSHDSGSDNTDFQTNVAAQTITATLSQALAAGDVVMGSLDNGATWTDITSMVSGTTLTWTGATLVANGGIRLRTLDEHGNIGSTTPKPYVLDQAPPATTISSALFSADSGNDFILNAASQSLSGTLSANLAAGEIVEVSLNNGASWTTATATPGSSAWSLAGITLTGSSTLRVRVTDEVGNHGTALTRAYVLDQAAPTASMPASTQLVAPSGASFTVTVTYADTGGAGIDTATFGTGNIRVTGPLGTLAVSGYSASGSTVTYTVSAPGGSWDPADAGQYTVAIQPNSVRDQAGNAVAANASAGTIDVVYSTAAAVGALRLSADTGTSDTDFITNAAVQTIQATLSRALGAGETVWGSLDNGGSWTDITAKTSGTAVAWDGVTLAAGGTIVIRALDGNGLTGTPASHAYKLDTGVPVQTVLTAALAADSGTPGDFITKVENQSIAGTLSAPLAADEFVQVSFDNGATWMAASTSGTGWSLDGFTLPSAGTLQVRVSDIAGNGGTPWAHAYRLDTSAPAANVLSAALASDSGVNGDFITNVASQSLAGTLSAPLGAGEFVEVSFDNGASWTAASTSGSTWTLNGVALAGAGTLQVRVSDIADNHGTAWSHSYRLDTAAPTAGNPVRADMRDPSGASFSFTVTYADGGAGIDPASIGAGNVSVTGPGGALNVLGASASGNTVTYTVEAPGGSWDPLDAGSYTIGINAQVKDLAGNTVAANAAAHSFTVGVNSAPTLGGVFATPAIADDTTASPFAGVTVADLDGDALTLTIAYSAANGTLSGTGLSGSAGN